MSEINKAYHLFFNTPEGKLILDDLDAQFGGAIARQDAHATAIRAGEWNVLDYLKQKLPRESDGR